MSDRQSVAATLRATLRRLRVVHAAAATGLAGMIALIAASATGHEVRVDALTIEHPYTFPTPGVAPAAPAYMSIVNAGADDTLLAIEADAARRASFHRTEDDGTSLHIRHLDAVPIPAGETVTFAPRGLFVMLEGLRGDPFELGESVPVTLVFERAGRIDVTLSVSPRDAPFAHDPDHAAQTANAALSGGLQEPLALPDKATPPPAGPILAVSGDATMRPVTIRAAAEVGGAPFACGRVYPGLGTSGVEAVLSDFRIYLSDPYLISDGGRVPLELEQDGMWQDGAVALLDFEDGDLSCANGTVQVNTTLRGMAPDGDYTGLAFTIGVPFERNHGDPTLAPSPLNVTGLFWNWRAGYRFAKIDFQPIGGLGWNLHLGSTRCASDGRTRPPVACENPNRIEVVLENFDIDTGTIVFDPAPVVAQADLAANAPDTVAGCMSFPGDVDCMTVMARLGQPYMGRPAETQRLVTGR